MKARELRLGVLGLGDAGTKAFPSAMATEGILLTAVAELRPNPRELFAKHHPDVRVFESLGDMCEGDLVDAVWIGTPSEFHADHAVAAMDRGKHVVCEKPMSLNLKDCDRIIDAVERNGVKLINHSHSSDPPIRKMREIIASGQLGRLISINTWNYKAGSTLCGVQTSSIPVAAAASFFARPRTRSRSYAASVAAV